MSANRNGASRIDLDNYQTPAEVARSFIVYEFGSAARGMRWGEPCRGEDAIFDLMPRHRRDWAEIRLGRDYLQYRMRADIIVTNPPFSLAEPFLAKSLEEAGTVAYLLRLGFLGSQKRRPFWEANPPTHLYALSERPVFVWVCKTKGCGAKYPIGHADPCACCGGKVGPGTDSADYAWFVWDRLGVMRRPAGIHVL